MDDEREEKTEEERDEDLRTRRCNGAELSEDVGASDEAVTLR
jgi:hypothetical protein